MTDVNHWVRCKACGGAVVLFTDGSRRVGHAKPLALVGTPNSVPCTLFQRLSAEKLWALHQDAETIEAPESFEPALG